MAKQRPFLKWAGGKYRCIENILPHLPKARRLVEPFTGSGAIFLNTLYPEYLLADGNQDLVNLYQQLQQEGPGFIDDCETYFNDCTNQSEQYYQYRNNFNQCDNNKLRALLFVYLNRHCYNGLCRYNLKGNYNVPFGRYKKPYFPRAELLYFYQKSQQVIFKQADFCETFSNTQPGDIIYCDPPYAPINQTSNFSAYTQKKFGEEEQILLANLAQDSAKQGIPVIISNHDTEFTRHHYRRSKIISFSVRRSINCNSSERKFIKELVAVFK